MPKRKWCPSWADMSSNCASCHTNTTYIIRDHHCYWQITTINYGNISFWFYLFSWVILFHIASPNVSQPCPQGLLNFLPIFTSCSHAGQKAGTTNFGTRGSLARKNCQAGNLLVCYGTQAVFLLTYRSYIGKLYVYWIETCVKTVENLTIYTCSDACM
jgi:hypothetical protein